MRVGIDCRKIADFGIGSYARGLLHGLAGLDGDDEYVAFVPREARGLVPKNVECVVADVPNYSVRELLVMGRAIKAARLDVFHSAHYVLPWTSCPSVTTIHDMILFHFRPARFGASQYLRWMTRRALRKSARVLTVSDAARTAIVQRFPSAAQKLIVTPNGVDPLFFDDGPAAGDLGRYFLFVGNDKPHKNLSTLINAFQRLSDKTVRLVLVGAPFERYRALPGVVTTGYVAMSRLAEIYRGAIAVVVPSLEEGFGLPVVEAMACGTPVVASEIPSLVEVAGGAALHADPRSSNSFGLAMERLLRDQALRHDLSARGRVHAARYTWQKCAEATREVYRSVAGAARASR
jgi:glycosyltransferase involved in cell wall biosynthesis